MFVENFRIIPWIKQKLHCPKLLFLLKLNLQVIALSCIQFFKANFGYKILSQHWVTNWPDIGLFILSYLRNR